MIQLENVSRKIGDTTILSDISLTVPSNQISILFGPSGSGKTTLCRVCALLDAPTSGEWKMNNKLLSFPLQREKIARPYPEIGFVYQQLFLWPHLKNRKNISLALGKESYENNQKVDQLADQLEIRPTLDRYPNEISIGQRQRVAIARTLILDPKFIFFDEITSALDIVQTKRIGSIIRKLADDGIGILMVTHDLHAFKEIGDRFIFLEAGKIAEIGSRDILSYPKGNSLKSFLS